MNSPSHNSDYYELVYNLRENINDSDLIESILSKNILNLLSNPKSRIELAKVGCCELLVDITNLYISNPKIIESCCTVFSNLAYNLR